MFGEPQWLVAARAAFDFVLSTLRDDDGRLLHAWRAGRAGARAMLDDYAALARAALALFEASGDPNDLDAAIALATEALGLFGDDAGGVYLTASDAGDVPGARPRHAHDGATPSGVGLLAEVLARLWHLTAEPRWRAAADGLIRAFSGAPEGVGGSPLLLLAADLLERGGCIVVDGPLDDPSRPSARRRRSPRVRSCADRPASRSAPVAQRLAARRSAADAARLSPILCRGQTCSLPVATPDALAQLVAGPILTARRRASDRRAREW